MTPHKGFQFPISNFQLSISKRLRSQLAPFAVAVLVALSVLGFTAGCGGSEQSDPRLPETDKRVREKWGKPYDELDTVRLVVISPHNVDIEKEYEAAFTLHHAIEYGQKVDIEWRDVGGGGSAILRFLRGRYERNKTSDIDVVWGGGDYNFRKMASEDILQAMEIPPDALANIPERFCGLRMYDERRRWCGSAISGFGFLYNAPLLELLNCSPPGRWEDLADPRFHGLVGLADPTQSGSATAAYAMIIQSTGDWQKGWARLLGILGNVKKFYAGAGDAADAPGLGEAPLATCIDFYGVNRVAKYPNSLVYLSPKGQTAFNPDPIAILKGPPHPQLAQRFVNYVLSEQGQAMWALRVGTDGGPIRSPLGRQPIRKDIYGKYGRQFLDRVINPYEAGYEMQLDTELWSVSFGVLRQLVHAAAVSNRDGLTAARKKLIDSGFDAELSAEFNRLPDNVATIEQARRTGALLSDEKQADIIVTDWTTFFRDKYRRISQ